jgi:N-acetylglutamate synthase-like GNAT family acetyltransferase
MAQNAILSEITIRTSLKPGDIGYIIHMHGRLYRQEYGYGILFETHVAMGLHEFCSEYAVDRDAAWICEHEGRIVGFLLLKHRQAGAQFRYFIIEPSYRAIGLGNKLMGLFMERLREGDYDSAYLWTNEELPAAAHLYTKFGFRKVEEKTSTALGKKIQEQRYELLLTKE